MFYVNHDEVSMVWFVGV